MARFSPRYHFRAASEYSALIFSYSQARSRSAREVMLTTYAMCGFELAEKVSCWTHPSLLRILKALSDAFLGIGARGNVEQTLIGFGVLHNSRRFALHGEHHWALAFL